MTQVQQIIEELKQKVDKLPKEANWFGNVDHIRQHIKELERALLQANVMRGGTPEPLAEQDAAEIIAKALGDELHLRQMIDLWCIDQLGNTGEALDKADAMFTAARDIFYKRSANGA